VTAYSKTVTNSLNVFGCPSDKWNAFNWNAFLWGSGTADLPVQVFHLVTNTLTPTEDSIGHAVRHLVTNTLTPTEDSIGHAIRHLVTNTLTPTEDVAGKLVFHLVTNTLTPTEDVVGHAVRHLISNTLVLTDAETTNFIKAIVNALAMAEDVSAVYVQDPNGYFKVFPEDTSNAHTQSRPTWTAGSPGTSAWATAAAAGTTWSDA